MRTYLLLPLLVGTLSACTVGRNYAGPPEVLSNSARHNFIRGTPDAMSNAPPLAEWWKSLSDPLLDSLVVSALTANNDIHAAQAKLREARAILSGQHAAQTPTVGASALSANVHIPGLNLTQNEHGGDVPGANEGGGSQNLKLYNLGFDASWEIDLFGGQRRSVEAARANLEKADASLDDVKVSLSAEVAKNYINLRDHQQRLSLGEKSIALQLEMLDLERRRFEGGTATAIDVADAERRLASTQAQLAPLVAERASCLDALAVLTGHEPGKLDASLWHGEPVPLPPALVPIGDPARLIANRPDIRVAERQLAADTARIGQAEAARFPHLSFMGLIGTGGNKVDDLAKLDDFVAIVAPRLSWKFLDFGRNKANVKQAEAVRDQAEAHYRSKVLNALRDAEDSLARFRQGRISVAYLARVRDKAALTERLISDRFEAGAATKIAVLNARSDLSSAEQDLSSGQATLTIQYISVQKALGLAWR